MFVGILKIFKDMPPWKIAEGKFEGNLKGTFSLSFYKLWRVEVIFFCAPATPTCLNQDVKLDLH